MSDAEPELHTHSSEPRGENRQASLEKPPSLTAEEEVSASRPPSLTLLFGLLALALVVAITLAALILRHSLLGR